MNSKLELIIQCLGTQNDNRAIHIFHYFCLSIYLQLLRIIAQISSVLFHPLLMVAFILLLYIKLDPFAFSLQADNERIVFITYTIVNSIIIPVLAILIMKLLGMVKSMEMKDAKERIGPLIVIGTLYLWMFINYRNNAAIPPLFVSFILGSIIAIFIAFFINNFTKISLHMIGMGGILMAIITMNLISDYSSLYVKIGNWFLISFSLDLILILAIVVSGLVASSRLILKAHQPKDLLGGFLVGILAQIIAFRVIF